MDAPNPSAIPTAASRTPVHIGAVGDLVRDRDRVTAYYRDLLGLTVQEHTPGVAILGVDGVPLLELAHRPDALPDDPREAGLLPHGVSDADPRGPGAVDLARREKPCAHHRRVRP